MFCHSIRLVFVCFLITGTLAVSLSGCSAERRAQSASDSSTDSWRVLDGKRNDLMMFDYYVTRAQAKVERLRKEFGPSTFIERQDQIRKSLTAMYRMPEVRGIPRAELIRQTKIDGLNVDLLLLNIRPGIYSTATVYRPKSANAASGEIRYPAILMLPGHGDAGCSPSVQSRCLSFAKQGYIVMFVEPFGQEQRGDEPLWSECHNSQSIAYLLVTGQSLLGLIMSDHQAELDYLASREDVDSKRIAVTGASMGGTHSVWLSAIEKRLKATAAIAVAPLDQPTWGLGHHCLCDTMVGLYDVADQEMIRGLVAPRGLLVINPGVNARLKPEAERQVMEGTLALDNALKEHRLTDEELSLLNPLTRQSYDKLGVPGNYREMVVEGPHDYTPPMREIALGWMEHFLKGSASMSPVSEGELFPITDRQKFIEALCFWPNGERPKDMLSPTRYVQREISALISKLPPAPSSIGRWKTASDTLRSSVLAKLRMPAAAASIRPETVGRFSVDGSDALKLVCRPESGIELPMLLFAPKTGVKPNGRMVVLLDPNGKSATAASDERRELCAQGAWVLCPDLRGMGETRYSGQFTGYLGYRDYDIAIGSLKLGDTLAGYWVSDLLAVIESSRYVTHKLDSVKVIGNSELGLAAILAAGQSSSIDAVEARGVLASYYSQAGYGLPYAYAGPNNDKSVCSRKLGGLGTMLPCIPDMLKVADIPQLAALVAPKPLRITNPVWASGGVVSAEEVENVFGWTKAAYRCTGANGKFTAETSPATH